MGSHLGHLDCSSPSHLIQPTIHYQVLSRNSQDFSQVASRSSASVKGPPHPLTFQCRLHRVAKLPRPPSPSPSSLHSQHNRLQEDFPSPSLVLPLTGSTPQLPGVHHPSDTPSETRIARGKTSTKPTYQVRHYTRTSCILTLLLPGAAPSSSLK